MYQPRTANYSKQDPVKRWALPDRVFFACGACHILAHAFLQRYGTGEMKLVWLKPDPGHVGNHIFIENTQWIFDYHGYSRPELFHAHTQRRAGQHWPGWGARKVELPRNVLISERLSRTYEGLWLREPKQFLHNALPRAVRFLERFPAPIISEESYANPY